MFLKVVVRFTFDVKTILSLLGAYYSTKYFSPTIVSFHNGTVMLLVALLPTDVLGVVLVVLVFVVVGVFVGVVVVVALGGTGGT